MNDISNTNEIVTVTSDKEAKKYLEAGWRLTLAYAEDSGGERPSQSPRFVLGWRESGPATYPENRSVYDHL